MGPRKPNRYSEHALTAMRERALEPKWVESAVFEPDWLEPDPLRADSERRFKALPERNGRVLRVAIVETEYEIRIITAFLDRRARNLE